MQRLRSHLDGSRHGDRRCNLIQVLRIILHNLVHVLHSDISGGAAAAIGRNLNGIRSHGGETVCDVIGQAVAQAHNDNHRHHADDNAQHRQDRSRLAGPYVLQCQRTRFQYSHGFTASPAIRGVTTASGASAGPS